MTVDNTPTIDQFRPVVLRVLSDGQERSIREIYQLAADYLRLSEGVRAERYLQVSNATSIASTGLVQHLPKVAFLSDHDARTTALLTMEE